FKMDAKYPDTVKATIPRGAIQPINVFSPKLSPVPIVDKKIDSGRTANIINNTYQYICGLKMCNNVSVFNDAVNIINIAEINMIEIFSLKCLISATELIPILANVIPIAVTAKSPVPCVISSAIVNVKITMTKTAGDFKNSGI